MLHPHDLPSPAPSRRGAQLGGDASTRVLEAAARELIAPAWALGVRSSALRRPPRASRRERELLDFVAAQTSRVARVLYGVFDYLYLDERGELPVDARPCEMAEVCRAAIEELREAGFDAEIAYEAQGDGAGEWDPGRLAQAISYLVEIAAAHRGSAGTVSLRWRAEVDEVVLRVEAGRGLPSSIDPEWGDRLEEQGEGGLRAFLARRIVRAHGGALARFCSPDAISLAMSLPRHAPEDPEDDTRH